MTPVEAPGWLVMTVVNKPEPSDEEKRERGGEIGVVGVLELVDWGVVEIWVKEVKFKEVGCSNYY